MKMRINAGIESRQIPDIQKAMNIDMIRENNGCCFFSFGMGLIHGLADYALH